MVARARATRAGAPQSPHLPPLSPSQASRLRSQSPALHAGNALQLLFRDFDSQHAQPQGRTALWDIESSPHAFSSPLTPSSGRGKEPKRKASPTVVKCRLSLHPGACVGLAGWGMVSLSSGRSYCLLKTGCPDPESSWNGAREWTGAAAGPIVVAAVHEELSQISRLLLGGWMRASGSSAFLHSQVVEPGPGVQQPA
jgi:hypothetical protein